MMTESEAFDHPTYSKMPVTRMLQELGDDASKWADAYVEHQLAQDGPALVGWFANAIENASTVRRHRVICSTDAEFEAHIQDLRDSRAALDRLIQG